MGGLVRTRLHGLPTSGSYRAIYTVRFEGAVYVLHAFQKKSPSGIRTAQQDIQLIRERMRRARDDYEDQRFGMEGKGE